MRLLLAHGADINALPGSAAHGNALGAAVAAWRPSEVIVRLLLDCGVEVKAQRKRLLEAGGDEEDEFGGPLVEAAFKG